LRIWPSFPRDTTEQIKAENRAPQSQRGAEKANRAKSEFLANMSHELRTPLNAIIGFSEILEDQTFGGLNRRQTTYITHILNSGRHLLQLINDILDLAKVEAGRIALEITMVNIESLLKNSLLMIDDEVHKRKLKLAFTIQEDLKNTQIPADEAKLKQIMYNLLSNAAKFTHEGGSIDVRAKKDGHALVISVVDTGIGLRPEDHDLIFRAFEQVDSSYARNQEGAGLGLALTRRLVHLHGGRIWAQSDGPGQGSVFSVSIPIPDADYREPSTRLPLQIIPPMGLESGDDDSSPTVLVVEDDPDASELITHYLTDAGYAVVQAYDGEQAIRMAEELKPFAITLDVIMPKKSGFDVLIELKNRPTIRDIPVVMITVETIGKSV
jgi:CheY-like chemotaxis protein